MTEAVVNCFNALLEQFGRVCWPLWKRQNSSGSCKDQDRLVQELRIGVML